MMNLIRVSALATVSLSGSLLAAPIDVGSLPANTWTEQSLTGWKGKDYYGNEQVFAWTSAGEHGLLLLDIAKSHASTAIVRRLDPATGTWTEFATAPLERPLLNIYKAPDEEYLHGVQLCYDSDRKVLVGLTATDLDGRGRVVEFDLANKKTASAMPEQSPPVVTAASLAYDPVNREVVLATGGFSPVGGTDGTWLYDGAKQAWRRLETPKAIDDVRLPAESARDRLITLRWLVWKNLEFRATGREKLLDDRAKVEALAGEAARLAAGIKSLADAAGAGATRSGQQHHKACLTSAGKLLADAAGKLAGLDALIKSGTPEELESPYRGQVVPALEDMERAVHELAVTPEPRMSARLIYDPKNKVIVCFGGNGQRCSYADTWVYHCEGRWWERKHPKSHPPPSEVRAAAYVPGLGVVVNWRLVYDAAGNEWQQLPGAPAGMMWMDYDAPAGCLVAVDVDWRKAWICRPDPAGLKPLDAKETDEIVWVDTKGEFVLRDAAGVADLKKWQTEMGAWVSDVAANTWVTVPTHGTGRPNWGRSWSSIVHDPSRRQIVYRDGGHGSYHGAVSDHYDLPTGRWFRGDLRDNPPWPMGTYFGWGRSFSLAPWCIHTYKYNLWYNPLVKLIQRNIGQSGRFSGFLPGGVLQYDPDTGKWGREPVSPGIKAGGVLGGGTFIPGLPDAMLAIDNFTRYGTKNGAATLIARTGTRQFTALGTLPRPHNDHNWCWFYDPMRNRAMYYAAEKAGNTGRLFALDLSVVKPKWEELKVRPAEEGGRLPLSSREIVYVPRYDVFIMLAGGRHEAQKDVEAWVLDARTWTMSLLPLAAQAPKDADPSQGLQYDPVTDLCYYICNSGRTPAMQAFRYAPPPK